MIVVVSRAYEDMQVGDVYRSRFGRTVLEADNVWFTLLTRNISFTISYLDPGLPRHIVTHRG